MDLLSFILGRDITDIDMKKILVGEFEEELKGLFRWSEGCSVFLARIKI